VGLSHCKAPRKEILAKAVFLGGLVHCVRSVEREVLIFNPLFRVLRCALQTSRFPLAQDVCAHFSNNTPTQKTARLISSRRACVRPLVRSSRRRSAFPPLPIHARRPTNASIVASSPGPTARQPLCSAVRMGTGSLTRRPCPVSCSDACRSASCKGRTHTLALLVGAWNSLQLQRIFACIDFWNFTFVLLLVCVLFFFQNSWSWSVYVRFNVGLIGWPVCAGNLNLCPDFVSWLQCENGVNVFEIFASFVAFLSTWSRT